MNVHNPHSPAPQSVAGDTAAPYVFPTSRGGNPILGTFTDADMSALVAQITLAAHQAAHAYLVHEGHPTSAGHIEPLLKAANHRRMSMQGGA